MAELAFVSRSHDGGTPRQLPVMTPIAIELARDLLALAADDSEESLSDEAAEQTKAFRDRVQVEYGVRLPGVRYRLDDTIPSTTYRLLVREVPVASGSRPAGLGEVLSRLERALLGHHLSSLLNIVQVEEALKSTVADRGEEARRNAVAAQPSSTTKTRAHGILDDPERFRRFHALLRQLLIDGGSVSNTDAILTALPSTWDRFPTRTLACVVRTRVQARPDVQQQTPATRIASAGVERLRERICYEADGPVLRPAAAAALVVAVRGLSSMGWTSLVLDDDLERVARGLLKQTVPDMTILVSSEADQMQPDDRPVDVVVSDPDAVVDRPPSAPPADASAAWLVKSDLHERSRRIPRHDVERQPQDDGAAKLLHEHGHGLLPAARATIGGLVVNGTPTLVVGFGEAWSRSSQETRQRALDGFADDVESVVSGLGFSCSTLRIEVDEAGAVARPWPVSMTIDGRPCRVEAGGDPDGNQDVDALRGLLLRTLVSNIGLAVTKGVVQEQWERVARGREKPPAQLHEALTNLVRLGRAMGVRQIRAARNCSFDTERLHDVLPPPRATVEVEPDYLAALRRCGGGDLHRRLTLLHDGLFHELGVRFPQVAFVERDLGRDVFRLVVNDLPLARRRGIAADQYLVDENAERLRLLGVDGEPTSHPGTGSEAAVIRGGDRYVCESADLTVWDVWDSFVLALAADLRSWAHAFLTITQVEYDLSILSEWMPELIRRTRLCIDTPALTRLLRSLVEEGVSIRDMPAILEALLLSTASPSSTDRQQVVRDALADRTVASLRRSDDQPELVVAPVDDRIARRLRADPRLDRRESAALVRAVYDVCGAARGPVTPVLVVDGDVRRRLRDHLSVEFPRLAVLSPTELTLETPTYPLSVISIDPPT